MENHKSFLNVLKKFCLKNNVYSNVLYIFKELFIYINMNTKKKKYIYE